MILKPRRIFRKQGNRWIRSIFIRKSCGICNNAFCHKLILLGPHRLGEFQDICLYTPLGNKFVAYLYDGEIAKSL
jgi:hypothetical protein